MYEVVYLNNSLFCKRLKEARTNKKMTQKQLSKITGISSVMISAYENENTSFGKNPALSNVYLLATALGVSIDWLCGLSDGSELQEVILSEKNLLVNAIVTLATALNKRTTQKGG